MTASEPASRVLVVANRTASTPALLDEVGRRAQSGAQFTVLVPPEKAEDWSVDEAVELVQRSAREPVGRLDAGGDALETIKQAMEAGDFDALIVSTAPEHLSRWVHHDLPHRLRHLNAPVLVIPPEQDKPLDEDVAGVMHEDWMPGSGGGGASIF